jgi:Flp pilus assembly pilin Flp
MKTLSRLMVRSLKDDRGGEVVEYVLILGLITLASLLLMGSLGIKVAGRWTSLYDSL